MQNNYAPTMHKPSADVTSKSLALDGEKKAVIMKFGFRPATRSGAVSCYARTP